MKKVFILATLLAAELTSYGFSDTPGVAAYCNARNIYPYQSPFVTYGFQTVAVPAQNLLKDSQQFVPGFGNKVYWWTMNPGEWVVYKDYEYMDLELRTELDGQIMYENHSIYEFRLGLGNRIRNQAGANGVMQPWSDTGWSYGNPGELFSEWDWGYSDELTDVTPITTRFYNRCTIRTVWKLANRYPQLMIGPAEVLLVWSGQWWLPKTFYAVATTTPMIQPTIFYYPQGINNMIISPGTKPNYRLNGPPIIDSSCACPMPRG